MKPMSLARIRIYYWIPQVLKTVFICSEMEGDSVRCWAARRSCLVLFRDNFGQRLVSGTIAWMPTAFETHMPSGRNIQVVVPRCANEWSPVAGAAAWSIEFSKTGFGGIALPGLHCGYGASPGAPRARA